MPEGLLTLGLMWGSALTASEGNPAHYPDQAKTHRRYPAEKHLGGSGLVDVGPRSSNCGR
jgi:hypothetical protein